MDNYAVMEKEKKETGRAERPSSSDAAGLVNSRFRTAPGLVPENLRIHYRLGEPFSHRSRVIQRQPRNHEDIDQSFPFIRMPLCNIYKGENKIMNNSFTDPQNPQLGWSSVVSFQSNPDTHVFERFQVQKENVINAPGGYTSSQIVTRGVDTCTVVVVSKDNRHVMAHLDRTDLAGGLEKITAQIPPEDDFPDIFISLEDDRKYGGERALFAMNLINIYFNRRDILNLDSDEPLPLELTRNLPEEHHVRILCRSLPAAEGDDHPESFQHPEIGLAVNPQGGLSIFGSFSVNGQRTETLEAAVADMRNRGENPFFELGVHDNQEEFNQLAVNQITPTAVRVRTEIANYTPDRIAGLQQYDIVVIGKYYPEIFIRYNAAQLSAFAPQNMQKLTEDPFKIFPADKISHFLPGQIGGLSNEQIKALPPDCVAALTGAQLQSLTGAQLQSLTGVQLQSLTGAQLQSLTGAQLQSLTGAQIQTLTGTQLAALDRNGRAALLGVLQPADIRRMTSGQLLLFSDDGSEENLHMLLNDDNEMLWTAIYERLHPLLALFKGCC